MSAAVAALVPATGSAALFDTDNDGLSNTAEQFTYGTNPNKADTDMDGLNDGAEVNTYKTNPKNIDTDGDRIKDGAEVRGITDGAEVAKWKSDPAKADTDGDGFNDYQEVTAAPKTDPRNASSRPVAKLDSVTKTGTTASYSFSSPDPGTTYTCQLAEAALALKTLSANRPCTSPAVYNMADYSWSGVVQRLIFTVTAKAASGASTQLTDQTYNNGDFVY